MDCPYPPTLLLFTWILWLMPYISAFAIWLVATFLLYATAVWVILPRDGIIMLGTVPVAVLVNAQLGQTGFLTAGLIGLSLALVERRPVLAGTVLGLLIYKPQFGALFPLALIAGGQWRVIGSAAATCLILATGVTLILGNEIWPAYVDSFRTYDMRLMPDLMWIRFQSVFGGLQMAGASTAFAWSIHIIVAIFVAVVVCAIWFRPVPYPLKAAALCSGAVAITPYILTYDLCILTIAAAFLIKDGLVRGFLDGERSLLLLCFVLSLLLTESVGPLLWVLILGVVVWRTLAVPRIEPHRTEALV